MGDVYALRPGTPADEPAQDAPLYCRRPGCSTEVTAKDRGRPAEFCSTRCQKRFPRDRAKAERALAHAQRVLEQYDQAPTSAAERPIDVTPSRSGAPVDRISASRALQSQTMAFALLAHAVEVAAAQLAQAPDYPGSIEQAASDLALARRHAYRILAEE